MTKAALILGLIATAAGTPVAAQAQTPTSVRATPPLSTVRYTETWSYLADPTRRTGRWTDPLRYIPISDEGDVYLTTGLEARARYETYENGQWGAQSDNDYTWSRLMPHADLHLGKVGVFAQAIVTEVSGSERPETSVDTTGADILQAFVDVELDVGRETTLELVAGRRLRSLGAGRLVDTRYGVNVPLAFDGAEATLTRGTRRITALGLRPVDNRLDDFDDRSSDQKSLWGFYGTQWLEADRRTGVDLYWLGFRDRNAIYDQGAGRQVVHSFGLRYFGVNGPWRWNVEGVVQRGEFNGARNVAWGVGGEVGRRFETVRLKPELALTVDFVSGDDDPDDPKLGTFNALFPRGRYFLAQSPVGPRNLIQIQPAVTLHPRADVDVTLMGAAYWRESTRDGIYSIPGFLVRSGRDSSERFIGSQVDLSVTWHVTPELDLAVSTGAFEAGAFIRDTGPSQTILLGSASATFRY